MARVEDNGFGRRLKRLYEEAYDYFFSCEFRQLEMLLHYLKKYVDLERSHYIIEDTMPE